MNAMLGWDSLLSIYKRVPDAATGEMILVRRPELGGLESQSGAVAPSSCCGGAAAVASAVSQFGGAPVPAAAAPLFSGGSAPAAAPAASPFGCAPVTAAAPWLFGGGSAPAVAPSASPFGCATVNAAAAPLFGGGSALAVAPSASPFGCAPVNAAAAPPLFGGGGGPTPTLTCGAVPAATNCFHFSAAPAASPVGAATLAAGGFFGLRPATPPRQVGTGQPQFQIERERDSRQSSAEWSYHSITKMSAYQVRSSARQPPTRPPT